jgi:hypothetical protein
MNTPTTPFTPSATQMAALWGALALTALLSLALWRLPSLRRPSVWWAWSLSGAALIGLYMTLFGLANIVGSGQKFSARGAVSNLRKLLWAQGLCAQHTDRPCALSELSGARRPEGVTAPLLPPEFRLLDAPLPAGGPWAEVGRVGQYLYAVAPRPPRLTAALGGDEAPLSRRAWVAYAWPEEDATLQSFCVTHYEEILELPKRGVYVGIERAPAPDACLGALHEDPNPPPTPEQAAALAEGRRAIPSTHAGADGETWERWRGKRTRISRRLRP